MRVFVIDSNLDRLNETTARLSQHGYDVMGTVNGTMARQIIGLFKPAVVIVDPLLDDVDSLALTKELVPTPVVLLSNLVSNDIKQIASFIKPAAWVQRKEGTQELIKAVHAATRSCSTHSGLFLVPEPLSLVVPPQVLTLVERSAIIRARAAKARSNDTGLLNRSAAARARARAILNRPVCRNVWAA